MKIEWLKAGLQIHGLGITKKGNQEDVSKAQAEGFIAEGIAKAVKARQNNKEDKSSEENK